MFFLYSKNAATAMRNEDFKYIINRNTTNNNYTPFSL